MLFRGCLLSSLYLLACCLLAGSVTVELYGDTNLEAQHGIDNPVRLNLGDELEIFCLLLGDLFRYEMESEFLACTTQRSIVGFCGRGMFLFNITINIDNAPSLGTGELYIPGQRYYFAILTEPNASGAQCIEGAKFVLDVIEDSVVTTGSNGGGTNSGNMQTGELSSDDDPLLSSTEAIIVAVVSVGFVIIVVVCLLMCVVCYCCCCRKKKSKQDLEASSKPSIDETDAAKKKAKKEEQQKEKEDLSKKNDDIAKKEIKKEKPLKSEKEQPKGEKKNPKLGKDQPEVEINIPSKRAPSRPSAPSKPPAHEAKKTPAGVSYKKIDDKVDIDGGTPSNRSQRNGSMAQPGRPHQTDSSDKNKALKNKVGPRDSSSGKDVAKSDNSKGTKGSSAGAAAKRSSVSQRRAAPEPPTVTRSVGALSRNSNSKKGQRATQSLTSHT